jgi:hypothetical protein
MADTIRIKRSITYKHQANLGEEVSEIALSEGDELAVLQDWEHSWLAKTSDGKLFNVKKDAAEPV